MHELKRMVGLVALVWISAQGFSVAQLTPAALADQMEAKLQEQIRDINRLTITTRMASGPAQGFSETSRFEKVIKDGRAVMVAADDDSDVNLALGLETDMLLEMVRQAGTVERAAQDGVRMYKVHVDDPAVLRELGQMGDVDDDLDDFEPKSATLWLDAGDFRVYRVKMVQAGPDGEEMKVDMGFSDYRMYQGLPIAHRVNMQITGMQTMMDQSEMQEAMRELEQMKAQLAQMPSEQRAMIEGMLAPQLEQLEKMMESGALEMEIRVTNVSVE